MLNADELVPTRLSRRVAPLPAVLAENGPVFDDRPNVLADASVEAARTPIEAGELPPAFVRAGPRAELAFDPADVRAGLVTCGGLCPGLNDVIRSITFSLLYLYGVDQIDGFRYGYAGVAGEDPPPLALNHDVVDSIHREGGTLLGSSRGPQDVDRMVDNLVQRKISILFCIGGDGTLRGASAISAAAARRGIDLAVVGVPKTIDNDLLWVDRSFGFPTAVEMATEAISVAHNEARGAFNGVSIVKLMGRHSGFIAAHATLANPDCNVCLVPEVPFELDGPSGLLAFLDRRLARSRHCVIAIAEGAGQGFVAADGFDESGNKRLGDVGTFLRDRITEHFHTTGLPGTVRYIDPSYLVRGGPANAVDAEFCVSLGQHAVHAGMAGFTDVMVGHWNQRFTIVPLQAATQRRRQLEPEGPIWQRVVQTTRQPVFTNGPPTDRT
ncbi:MAG: ATP-dependent 6-phosphofructokinase [Acidimicrobiales bacterium]|nr:ATP-dependent 6-phosphofructokinase [Acidimicrobiales bacterium]